MGLSSWVGDQMQGLSVFPPLIIVAGVTLIISFLTELTSNTATTQMVLPILASIAVAMKTHPLLLMIPAALSASCAFMMPVATPPNAIVFGSGRVKIGEMVKAGLLINIIGIVVVTTFFLLVGKAVFAIKTGVLPVWAQ